ncbi:ABC transporter permease [Psychrosphaera sp. B3R10]|uniref:ABC transporter permease n=1 Tax=unclassified Psychrosphaera TaxID=2641570 RepID=UPI001C09CD36|nr:MULTISPECIES: ABC transporter permease [unclassified Psychrosphaera]MBU2882034.1 ABC transporter permease [Psychrosphaera sp. I2R16]MBU2989835.1 ABC transporter permease [Psychrosphaera sp. B3R10]MDO6721149.1 ABC transporter permease [Psychrosphaera sp. 1_MG-2023]
MPAYLVHFLHAVTLPIVGILVFLLIWSAAANNINTSLGKFPGPVAVSEQIVNLYNEHNESRKKEIAFYERQDKRNAARIAKDPTYNPKTRAFTGKETFVDQIGTSLITVLSGFVLAAIIAIPLGIAIGLSKALNTAINPVIQIFKPVSPLAWLPLVTMVVSALYVSPDPMVAKSFLVSMITVTLCCIWPMVINTSVGVASLDSDWINVSRVLRLPALKHIQKIVIPASIPAIFTGMRMSLGIAWMVLIAAEMLAQNPGLGKFVWDEFQNGSSDSLSRIMTAVIVIGLIGFMLDRTMMQLQRMLSWDKTSEVR